MQIDLRRGGGSGLVGGNWWGGCLRVKENPYTPFQSPPPFERGEKPSSVCTEMTTYRNDDGNGPDKRPDEMVINPQPAPTERKGKERYGAINSCHIEVESL